MESEIGTDKDRMYLESEGNRRVAFLFGFLNCLGRDFHWLGGFMLSHSELRFSRRGANL
jgi:hypothetical protein